MTKLVSLMLSGKTLQELNLSLPQYPEANFYLIYVDLINSVRGKYRHNSINVVLPNK